MRDRLHRLLLLFAVAAVTSAAVADDQSSPSSYRFNAYHAELVVDGAEAMIRPLTGGGEAGVVLTLEADTQLPGVAAVYFEFESEGRPFNIREEVDGEFRYLSTSNRNYVLLRSGPGSSATFYSEGFDVAKLRVLRSVPCDGVAIVCGRGGTLHRTLRVPGSPALLLAQPYRDADIETMGEVVTVGPRGNDAEGEYGVSIRLADGYAGRVAVNALRMPADRVSASVSSTDGSSYLEQYRTQLVLGPGDSALFFSASRDPFDVHVRSVVDCDGQHLNCGIDGFHYYRILPVSGGPALLARPLRAASVAMEGHRLTVSPELRGNFGEFGLVLHVDGSNDDRFAVAVTRRSMEPVSARISSVDGSRDLTATQRHFAVRGGEEILFFSSASQPFELTIDRVLPCDQAGVMCDPHGGVYLPIRSNDVSPTIAVYPFAGSDIELSSEDGHVAVQPPSDWDAEFGVLLRTHEAERPVLATFNRRPMGEVLARFRTAEGFRYLRDQRDYVVLDADDELLLYSRSGHPFRVEVESRWCDANDWRCRTKSEFVALLPTGTLGRGREYALALLQWASENSDYALTPGLAQQFEPNVGALHEVYFRYFDQNLGGGYCGGTAAFFRRLLDEHEIVAFTWNFGMIANDLTHVTTIVVIDGGFYMLDATLGRYLANPDTGALLDVREYLDGARGEFVPVPMTHRRFVGAVSERSSIARSEELVDCQVNDAAFTFSCRRPGFGLESYLTDSYPGLVENGLNPEPDTIRELMRKGLFSIGGSTRSEQAMRDFAHALDERGVPFIEIEGMTSPMELLDATAQ